MMKHKLLIFFTLCALCVSAQEEQKKSLISNVKLSGYIMTQYQYSGKEGSKANTFNIRMARLSLDGRIADDFYWKAQIQINGNTSTLGQSPRVVDLFAEWQKLECFRVKVGQFKRPFTFENPMNPIDQGFMSYSQNVSNLAGFTDRVGEHASNGRDIGIQVQGDVLKIANGRNLLHYQLGVYNGQGINVKDVDQRKDIIGGLWIMPVKGMRIGAFGWTGSYARKGKWIENNVSKSGIKSVDRIRYALSAEYKDADWTIRSEYIHSTGYSFNTTYDTKADLQKADIKYDAGNKADGLYVLSIAPVLKKKLYAKARYDCYRPQAEWNTMKTMYEVGLNYVIHKNVQINAEYAFVNDRKLAKHDYNMADIELDIRF